MHTEDRRLSRVLMLAALCVLTACTSAPKLASPVSAAEDDEPEAVAVQADIRWQPVWQDTDMVWHSRVFPGKRPTLYTATTIDGRDAIQGESLRSASLMRQKMRIEPESLGHISFARKVPQLIPEADMGLRDHDDSPVRVMLAFDGDRSRLSVKDTVMSELARTLTGEEMPYATLMYVWCNSRKPGSVIMSPRTDRVRSIVMESGPAHLNQWRDYQRDIRADFELAFGEPPGAIVGVAIMSDSDNTASSAKAWYGAVRIMPAAASTTAASAPALPR